MLFTVGFTLLCREAEAHVVSGPLSRGIAELRAESFPDFGEEVTAIHSGQSRCEALPEGLKPRSDVARKRGRTVDERDVSWFEAAARKALGIIFHRWEIPRVGSFAIDATTIERRNQCVLDLCDAAVPAHLRYKSATRF